MNALDLLRQEEHVTPNPALAAAAARPDTKTYDQERLINVTREHILRERFGNAASTTRLLIITDNPIPPPPEWRYIIWEMSPLTQPRGGFRNDEADFRSRLRHRHGAEDEAAEHDRADEIPDQLQGSPLVHRPPLFLACCKRRRAVLVPTPGK